MRETEKYIKTLLNEKPTAKQKGQTETYIAELENDISHFLGTKVKIRHGKQDKGKIEIYYYGNDDFERIMENLKN